MSGALVCDLDGTLIEGDLGLEFRRWLLDTGRFGMGRLLLAGTAMPFNRLRRSFGRGSLLSAWSAARSAADRTSLMEGFMAEVGDALSIRSEVMEVEIRLVDDLFSKVAQEFLSRLQDES